VHERQVQDGTTPDTTAPTADIVTPPDGADYVRNQTVGAYYSCEDEAGGSGLESCEGTVAQGQLIDTGSLGAKTFTVRATDNAGNVSSITSTYTVAECHITGTPGDDVLEGSAGSDRICGLGGNDTLKGLGGNDELVGGAGDDSLNGGPGTDAAYFTAASVGVTASLVTNQATGEGFDVMTSIENLIGSNHDDTLIGSGSKNYLSGRSGVDQLFGLEGHDRLMGGSQDDALRGGTGGDRIVANGGADDLFGEEGSDSLNSKDGVKANDALDGGTGTDACSTDPTEESIDNCEQQRD
jgi:Ca2+-binding RTX toxin-like protein